ncbi:chromosomal replication initiator DnaA [Oceanicola sp. D3]|uniref:DnaA/Hda family protein n=1 Tax=Oceanicola sp. D3 TaxID=2587163 RepID=UPI0011207442|nr:DnaA/Hda family protein [Oceanicola sp. D3]QDC09010.1 chromosomal replication initiator DnaA [Oceanicola sp. D3]
MPRQLPIDLPVIEATGRDAFFISPANADAAALIDDSPMWPNGRLLLSGPEGAGKSHLAAIWAADTCATRLDTLGLAQLPPPEPGSSLLVEDIHLILGTREQEEPLFHLLNRAAAAPARLLLTAREPLPPRALPDLETRLQATPRARLAEPDDMLLTALLVKHFTDRQLTPTQKLLDYLLPRMERSAAAARRLVIALDRHQLATGRKLSRKLAREVLDDGGFSGT